MFSLFSSKNYVKKLYKSKIEEINEDVFNKKYYDAMEKCLFLINILKNSGDTNSDIVKNLLERIIYYHKKSKQDTSLIMPIYEKLASLNCQKGHFKDAANVFEKMASISSGESSISNYRRAIELYELNVDSDNRIIDCKIKLANILFSFRRYVEACEEYKIQSNDVLNEYCFFRECFCYLALRNYDKIRKKLKEYSGFVHIRYNFIRKISSSIVKKDICIFMNARTEYNRYYNFTNIEKEIIKKIKYTLFSPKITFITEI